MRQIALLAICLCAATAAFAQKKAPAGPGPKSKQEMEAVNALVKAQTPDDKIKAVDALVTKFTSTDFKGIALYQAADAYEQKGDHAKAVVYAEEAIEADATNFRAEILIANILAGQTKDSDLDKSEKLARAEKLAKSGLEHAEKAQKTPLFQIPDAAWETSKKAAMAQGWSALGTIATVNKKTDEAVTDYEKALALDPDPIAMIRLGRVLMAAHKNDEAIAWYDKALAAPDANEQIKKIATSDKARATAAKGAK